MLVIERDYAVGVMSANNAPAAHCKDGDIVEFVTRDCFDDCIVSETGPMLPHKQFSNPVIGPLYIEGAEPGDVLKVDILKMEVADTGIIRTTPGCAPFDDIVTEKLPRIYQIRDNKIIFDDKLSLDLDIMIGCIGTAPAGEDIDTKTPGKHGGNMDCRKITQGCSLYLPVNTPGALFCLGDLHAKMADGEVASCGMECRGRVQVQVHVLKNVDLPTPMVVNDTHMMTIQSEPTLDEASVTASRAMRDFLVKSCGLDPIGACMLLSLVGDLIVCQIVDPLMTVRMEVPLDVLATYGVKLP